MNKILWQNTGGMPITVEDLEFLYNSDGGELSLLNAYFAGFTNNLTSSFIVTGCELVGGQIQSGYCYLDNRLVKVDAHTKGAGDYFSITTSYPTEGRKVFKNNISHDTWVKERGIVGATTGTLKYTGVRFTELFGAKNYLYAMTPPTFIPILNTDAEKIIQTINIPSTFRQGRYTIEWQVDVTQTVNSAGNGMYFTVDQSAGSAIGDTGVMSILNTSGFDNYLIYNTGSRIAISSSFYTIADIIPGETINLNLRNDNLGSGISVRCRGYIIN